VFAYRTKTTAGKTVDARKLAGRRDSFRWYATMADNSEM
jgi:hypothetical protein